MEKRRSFRGLAKNETPRYAKDMVNSVTAGRIANVLVILLSLLTALLALPSWAQELVATHGDWNVIRYVEGGKQFCYIHSVPINETGNYTRRGGPYVLVVRQGGGAGDQVSVTSGYPYKDGSEAELKIDDRTFKLFVHGEKAWARNAEEDKALVGAMIKGLRMTLRGTSQKGTYSLDTYSLRGFSRAHDEIVKACR